MQFHRVVSSRGDVAVNGERFGGSCLQWRCGQRVTLDDLGATGSLELLVVFEDGQESTVDCLTKRPTPFNPFPAARFESALRKRKRVQ